MGSLLAIFRVCLVFFVAFMNNGAKGQYQGYVVKIAASCRLTTDFYCAPHEGPITIHYGIQGYDFCHHTMCCPRSWDCVTLLTSDNIEDAKERCDGEFTCRLAVSRGGPACHKGFGDYTNITYTCGGDPNLILNVPDIHAGMANGVSVDAAVQPPQLIDNSLVGEALKHAPVASEQELYLAISSEDDSPDTDRWSSEEWDDWDDLKPGQITGIVIGTLLFVGLIAGLVAFFVIRKKRKSKAEEDALPRSLSPGAAEINAAMTASERGSRPPSRLSITSSSGSAPILFETSLVGDTQSRGSNSSTRRDATSVHTQADMLLANGFAPPQKHPPLIDMRPGGPQRGPPHPNRRQQQQYAPSRGSSTSGYASSSVGYQEGGRGAPPLNRPPIPVPRGEMPHQGHRMGLKLYDTPISVHMNSPTSPNAPGGSSSTVYEEIMDSPNSTYDQLNERTVNYNQRHTMSDLGMEVNNNRNSTVRFADNNMQPKFQQQQQRPQLNHRHTTTDVPDNTTYHYNQPPPSRPQSQATTPPGGLVLSPGGLSLPPGKAPHEMIVEENSEESEDEMDVHVEADERQEYLEPYVVMNQAAKQTEI